MGLILSAHICKPSIMSPAGLLINDVEIGLDRILITARCRVATGTCPDCGRQSKQMHSRYERRLLDLPSHGRAVQVRVAVRRFRCPEPSCRRHIFAERLGDTVAARSARRTSRLEAIVHPAVYRAIVVGLRAFERIGDDPVAVGFRIAPASRRGCC